MNRQETRTVPLSPQDRNYYHRMLECLNAITDSVTHGFQTKPEDRAEIAMKVCKVALEMFEAYGCGNLCTDRNHGCVPCDKVVDPES